MDETDATVDSTRTTFRILETLKRIDGGGPSEVARELEMASSTVHDHLRTLEALDFVVREDEAYQLGPRFLDYGGYARNRMKIFEEAEPEIQQLAIETGQHANLLIENDGMGIFLYKAKGSNAVQLDTFEGMRVHLHTTAMGKAILSQLPTERVEAIVDDHGLPAATERTVTDREELFEELRAIDDRGYATDDEERVSGMRCVGVPLQNDRDGVLGAISVSGPTNTLRGDRFHDEIPELLRRTANVIELNMTYA